MEFENSAPSTRPRPWLLIALGLAVVLLAANFMWPSTSTTPPVPASNQTRAAQQRRGQASVDPSDLSVRLDALNAPRPGAEPVERNPFRFQPKAPPPPPPGSASQSSPAASERSNLPPVAVAPPGPPPIPLKFIGIVEKQGFKVAAMSDCRSTYYGSEGQVIDGRYRLVRIGVESMVIEYTDGRGRTTVRLEGCPPR
jgi:hypothetical protein